MKILDKLEHRFRRYAVPNLTVGLIVCQVLVYITRFTRPVILEKLTLIPALVLQGEVWRLVTFLIQPPPTSALFAFFFWYLFYLMGTTLEQTWGVFRYNLFLLVGYAATVAVSFVTPEEPTLNVFLEGSVFLAFAFLYPEFRLVLFFLLPVKIKWLAMLQWIGYFYAVVFVPSWTVRLATLAAISNFLLFFWGDLLRRIWSGYWQMSHQAAEIRQRDQPRHQCRICGRTEKTDPQMSFRYCSKCAGSCCYCEEHLRSHEHVTAEAERSDSAFSAPSQPGAERS